MIRIALSGISLAWWGVAKLVPEELELSIT